MIVSDHVTHFTPTGEKPTTPHVMASATCGREQMTVRWVEVVDYVYYTEDCPEHSEEVIWVPAYGRTLAESGPLPRDAWRSPERLRDFVTRTLGPEPPLP